MCGIIGAISSKEININEGIKSILHRGPDHQDYCVYEKNDKIITLGHVRLAIIDLNSRSNQPFKVDDRYCLLFNGEIYNCDELKDFLGGKYNYKTESDTEVLAYWLIEYGVKRLDKLMGMFSFVFYDSKLGITIIARDQLGIKPIYIDQSDDSLFFSSELRGLWALKNKKSDIDSSFFEDYLNAGFVFEPNTGFKNVKKVLPGHYIKVDCNLKDIEQIQFSKNENDNKEFCIESAQNLIQDSINRHLVSNVPLGLFYSGGIDSSLILALGPKKLETLFARSNADDIKASGFPDDSYYGDKISKILGSNINYIETDDVNDLSFISKIKKVVDLNEEPIADFTSYPTSILSRRARENGLITMLSGMGADEIFGGYPRYLLVKYKGYSIILKPFINLFKKNKFFSKKISRFKGFWRGDTLLDSYLSLLTPFSKNEIDKLLLCNSNSLAQRLNQLWEKSLRDTDLKTVMNFDIYGFLSHNFVIADKASMSESIELRVPLATSKLFNFTMGLADNRLIRKLDTKYILKKILTSIIPRKLVYRRKTGFHPPIDKEILKIGEKNLIKLFQNSKFEDKINIEEIIKIIRNHFKGSENNTLKIYRLLFLKYWYEKNS